MTYQRPNFRHPDPVSYTHLDVYKRQLRTRLNAPANNLTQELYVSEILPTKRVMIKDENVCLHCGLCAERCPTAAWDMQKFLYNAPKACSL